MIVSKLYKLPFLAPFNIAFATVLSNAVQVGLTSICFISSKVNAMIFNIVSLICEDV
jgi:hypothetical protein